MFLTHWLELSGVDRLMAPVCDEDDRASSHGPEEQESSELAFWSVVAPRRPATSPGALRESGAGRNAHARRPIGSINRTDHIAVSLIETIAMGSSSGGPSREEGPPVECVHCHASTPTANGPASSYPDTGDTVEAL